MAGVNKVILIGNLGKDPEIRYTPSGVPVANFTLATTERMPAKEGGERQDRTEWHSIVVFNKLAELVHQYLKKGRSAYIEGRIQTRSWDDRDGNKKYRTEIVANTVQFLDSRDGGRQSSAPDRTSAPPIEPPASQVNEPVDDPGMGGAPPPEDDLPF